MGELLPRPLFAPATGDRWVALFVMTRLLAAATALTLLSVHRVTSNDPMLIAVTVGYTLASVAVVARSERLAAHPLLWLLDTAAVLGLVFASDDWRSPFYVLGLTTLILPATNLRFRPAVLWGIAFVVAYAVVGVLTGRLQPGDLETTVRLETAATHLLTPILVTLALAYASDVLDRLRAERQRSEQMALQAERQRIAWELHDSAKQRVHAAHLLLSAAATAGNGAGGEALQQALAELRAATADMETSVAELQSPLDGRPLHETLGERAAELRAATPAQVAVHGTAPSLPPLVEAHAQRIAAEALTNAVRHARAEHIELRMEDRGGVFTVTITDDGIGMPDTVRPGATGLRSMAGRAATIGARLDVDSGSDGQGTTVRLQIPRRNGKEPTQ